MDDPMAELAEIAGKITAYRGMDYGIDRSMAYKDAADHAVEFIRTHHAELEAMARDADLFRLLFTDEAGRELARKTLEAVKP